MSTTLPRLDAIQARADARRRYADERPEPLHVPEDYAALADESAADVPALSAAVRDVLAVADQLDRLAARHPDSETGRVETAAAHKIRAAVTAHIDTTPKESR